ncbi:MAG TPA: protein kinase [Pyrinomonadaceae bacterium]|nr:protein kinase [Pyrinomonadaceae bacterium]
MVERQTESITGNLIDHYRIGSLIGKGGMGEVYLAQDIQLGRQVALKLLSGDLTVQTERVRRFQQEARAASALNHPNILTIYQIGQTETAYFIATEFVEGETLRERLTRAPMELQGAVDVATQVASALGAAHAAGIVHRDVKPENVMIRRDGIVKVLDFGIAKLIEQELQTDSEALTKMKMSTNPGVMIGTVAYMSPEQARGYAVDARSDIWSLGVVLYEMLVQRRPFEGPTMSHIIVSLLEHEPAPLARGVPVDVQRIVSRALRKVQNDRYPTINDMLTELQTAKENLHFAARVRAGAATVISESGPAPKLPLTKESTGRFTSKKQRTRSSIDSLAVLPLVNASADPNMEYLSDGITENIINNLAQLPKLRVVPRNTVFRYKGREIDPHEIGQALNARVVLTGRVRQHGDRLIVGVELVDVLSESQLWGEQFNREFTDIFKIQEEIASEIIEKLRLRLTDAERKRLAKRHTRKTESYQLYLKGRFYWNKRTEEALKRGIEFFKQAIEVDPSYALAYAGIADCYAVLNFFGDLSPKDSAIKAMAAAKKALEIDDSIAEAHTSFGLIKLIYEWDWQSAERELTRAIKLSPNYPTARDWYSTYLMAIGKVDEAIHEIKNAQELDPLSPIITTGLARQLYYARRPEQAIEECLKILDMEPHFAPAHWFLGQAYEQQGRYDEAIDQLQQAVNYSGGRALMLSSLGYTYAVSGRRAEAEGVLDSLHDASRQNVPALTFAFVHAGLGQHDAAFEWLDKAYAERFGWLIFLSVDPKLDNLRSDPRFTALLHKLKLTT